MDLAKQALELCWAIEEIAPSEEQTAASVLAADLRKALENLGAPLSEGARRIAAERVRQIEAEGWTSGHDDQHTDESLAMAAACYAAPWPIFEQEVVPNRTPSGEKSEVIAKGPFAVVFRDPFPWRPWDKRGKHSRIRCLEIAGALIAAEIDRLLRQEANAAPPCGGSGA